MKVKTVYIIIFIIIFLVFIMMMVKSFSNITETMNEDGASPSESASLSAPVVIVDAGHGGEDGGAEVDGILEKDINLSISKKLSSLLVENGYQVIPVRVEDISIYDDGCETLSQKKTSDLNNRLELFNSDENNIVLSIHQNKFDVSKYHGAQVFYSRNNEESAVLAEYIRKAVISSTQPDNTRETKPADENIYVLYHATVPAVIVECGFMSNPEELALLNTDEYQSRIACAIFKGFDDYIKSR